MAQKFENARETSERLKKTYRCCPRTILNWCNQGYFLGAKKVRSLSGQYVWRIPAGAIPVFKKD